MTKEVGGMVDGRDEWWNLVRNEVRLSETGGPGPAEIQLQFMLSLRNRDKCLT
jgi:hypothetical protein